jgi:hypothetical protein
MVYGKSYWNGSELLTNEIFARGKLYMDGLAMAIINIFPQEIQFSLFAWEKGTIRKYHTEHV